MIERGDPLSAEKQVPFSGNRNTLFSWRSCEHDRTEKPVVCRDENHERPTVVCSEQASHPRFSRNSTNFNVEEMQIPIERRDPLCAHSQSVHPQRVTRWTSTWEHLDCHIQLRHKPKILVFVSSLRRSRTTLIDKIFKPNCSKIMPTTHLVKGPRRWLRTWAM